MSELLLKSISLTNYRAFERLHVELDPQLTVLIGDNGAGKSAVLDAACVLLSPWLRGLRLPTKELKGFRPHDARRSRDDSPEHSELAVPIFPVSGEATGTWRRGGSGAKSWHAHRELRTDKGRTTWGRGNLERWARHLRDGELVDNKSSVELPVICYYGTSRLWLHRRNQGRFGLDRTSAYDNALNAGSDLTRLTSWLRALYYEANRKNLSSPERDAIRNRLGAIEMAVNRVMAPTGWTGFDFSYQEESLVLRHEGFGELPLWMLSDGTRLMAGLVIDLASRMARANPLLGGDAVLEQVSGICMIDEVDQHLHPSWQQEILPSLLDAFPRMQFIVTTHSPQVLSNVEADRIRDLDSLNEGELGTVPYSRGLRPDVVLRDVMHTAPIPNSDERRELEQYLQMVYDGRGMTSEARELRRRLDVALGGIRNVPELGEADAHIAFEAMVDE